MCFFSLIYEKFLCHKESDSVMELDVLHKIKIYKIEKFLFSDEKRGELN